MDLPTMRARVETDLKDMGNTVWTDAELDRAIARAIGEYSAAAPPLARVDVAMGVSRWFDLSGQAGYLWCEAVEHPIDEGSFPEGKGGPSYRLFREDRQARKVYVLGDTPAAGENLRFWYAKSHTLDDVGSTIPVEHEELVTVGAAGFAALQISVYSIDRLGVTGATPGRWREWAEERLQEFRSRLEALRMSRVTGIGGAVAWNGIV